MPFPCDIPYDSSARSEIRDSPGVQDFHISLVLASIVSYFASLVIFGETIACLYRIINEILSG